jgi:transcriptional regulator GlxA family with amidase domain
VQIAILIFDRLTALDAVGPYEVLFRIPGAELCFVAKEPGPQRTDTGALGLEADRALADLQAPEVVLVPGGPGSRPLMGDREVLDWLRAVHETSTWTTSVCTGALVLGAAGILDGKRATTHWAYLERLGELGAEPVAERVVEDGKVMTSAGVSSGIDMALRLVSHEAGPEMAQAVQLAIEYDPEPPFDAGRPSKAPAALVDAVSHTLLQREQALLERDQSRES